MLSQLILPIKFRKNTISFLPIILSLLLVMTGCQNNSSIKGIEGKINRVISAQTLEVIIENKSYTLRLSGLEIPSNQEEIAKEGKQFLKDFFTPLNSATVIIDTDLQVKDKYDRLRGYVWYLDRMVNQELLKQGYGIANLNYTDGKFDRTLLNSQDYARIMEKGIWRIEN
jgi:micrococcal nuclease